MKYILAVLILAIVALVLIGPRPATAAVYSANYVSSVSTAVVSAPANLVSSAWLAINRLVGAVIGLFVPPDPPKKPEPPKKEPTTVETTWGGIKIIFH